MLANQMCLFWKFLCAPLEGDEVLVLVPVAPGENEIRTSKLSYLKRHILGEGERYINLGSMSAPLSVFFSDLSFLPHKNQDEETNLGYFKLWLPKPQ